MYMQPTTAEQSLPDNAAYNPAEEGLFSSSTSFVDSGRICEKGKGPLIPNKRGKNIKEQVRKIKESSFTVITQSWQCCHFCIVW